MYRNHRRGFTLIPGVPARRTSAFTLIELLVVIAIIAALAAILFPVLAQAREKARQITCTSHVKSFGHAFLMYAQDYDDTLLTQNNAFREAQEFQVLLQPYIKDRQIMYCPSRSNNNCSKLVDPSGACIGYAPNFGIYSYSNGWGIFRVPQTNPSSIGGSYWAGRSLAEFAHPAETILAGDTNDTNMYTLSHYYQTGDGISKSAIRHSGLYSFVFVDGHAKALKMATFSFLADGDAFTIMPENADYLNDYCYDVDAYSARPVITYYYYGLGMTCGQTAAKMARDRVKL